MTGKAVTIRDVAAALGVNPSTVSRALNPQTQGMITPEVVRNVNKMAQKMGYYPNRVAAALVQKRSYTIGVLIPDLMNPVFPPMIRGLQDTLDAEGYTVIVSSSDGHEEYEKTAYRKFRERAIDGFIMATALYQDTLVDECVRQNLPLVLMNRTVESGVVNSVVNDDAAGIRMAVDHLVSLGHTRIAHAAGPQNTSTGRTRLTEFEAHLESLGLEAGHVLEARNYSIDEGRRLAEEFLTASERPGAIIGANDLVALGCIDAIEAAGLNCPSDISVMGFDDIPLLDRMTPTLTTIAIPQYQIGVMAAQSLLKQLSQTESDVTITRLTPELIVRNSTSRPANR
jgi:LacI family transcriptional regulator